MISKRKESFWRNFLDGAASIFSIFPSEPAKGIPSFQEMFPKSDEEALRSDWEKIGQDMQKAIESHH